MDSAAELTHSTKTSTDDAFIPMSCCEFKQVPLRDSPPALIYSGSVLRPNPAELAARHSLVFERGQDDLDEFDWAVILISADNWIFLIRYRGSTLPGTTVMLDRDFTKATAAWVAFKHCFEISVADCLFIDPPLIAGSVT